MRKLFARNLWVSGAIALAALATGAVAIAAGTEEPPHKHWHFEGPFGTYDRAAAQRGYQVYHDVCSACHSLSLVSYRNLVDLGLTENQVKGLIQDISVPDLNDDGAPVDRPARLSDRIKKPFPNEAAAAAATNGKAPPDLKLIVTSKFSHAQMNDLCAPCHAKMQPLTTSYQPGDRYFDHFDVTTLEDWDFYPDGRDLGAMIELTRRDVVVLFDYHRYQRSAADLAARVHRAGATVVLVTDDLACPVAPEAEVVLTASSTVGTTYQSMTAGFLLTELLIPLVMDAIGEPARTRMALWEEQRRSELLD